MIIQHQIAWKWYNIQLYLQWPTNRKSYMVYGTAPFSMTLNNPYPQFQGHAILWRWLSQKRYDIHSVIEILKGTYTPPAQHCHFKWPWVTSQNIQWHEASCGLSATAELLVKNPNFPKIWRPDGFPTETACNPQFKLIVKTITLLAFNVQIKNALKH